LFELRPYQCEAVGAIYTNWFCETEYKCETLLVLPTGCGKTVVFATIAGDVVRVKHRVLILDHREELLSQATDKIYKITDVVCGLEKGD